MGNAHGFAAIRLNSIQALSHSEELPGQLIGARELSACHRPQTLDSPRIGSFKVVIDVDDAARVPLVD